MSGKTLVTGGAGLVGKSFQKKYKDFLYPTRNELNLIDRNQTFEYVKNANPQLVIHLAGTVGGVHANTENMHKFYSENMIINLNLIDACVEQKVPKLVCCLSTCIYPDEKYINYPLTEEQLHLGPPHESNFGYAYAKRMVDIHIKSIKQQHNLNYVSVVPNNIYGEHDNFDLENGHVIPALIRKIWEAKLQNKKIFEVWGDGNIFREFTYVDDIRDTIMFCEKNYHLQEPINIGTSNEYSLNNIINIICKLLDFKGEIVYNTNKPKGQLRKPSSNQKFVSLGWKKEDYISIEQGLTKTCNWFMKNYPNIRGCK
jgi:GDP-L-fucose synthase